MEENKIFRFVWRFNAIVIMLAGLLAIAVLGFAAIQIFKETMRERQRSNIVNLSDSSEVKEEWELGNLREIEGTPYLMLPLYSDQSYAQSYYSKSARSTRNYLFFDAETEERRWLFANNNYLIARDSFISETDYRSKSKTVQAILYNIIKEDTNGDKRLTDDDLITIALTKPNGYNYKELLSGLDSLLGYKVLNGDRILILYQRDGIAYSAKVSLSNFALSNQVQLPKVGD
ncbi:MAG: hypothetical protein AB4426_21300 [Xenococcaceae cyanobacterium]